MSARAFLSGVSTGRRRALACVTVAATVAEAVAFGRLGKVVTAGGGPSYDEFQRAGSAAAVERARSAWGEHGLAGARKAWLLDLAFPPSYGLMGALLSSLAASRAARRERERLTAAMAANSWLSLAAAATDLFAENPAVAVGLWGKPSDAAAGAAKAAGAVKRTLLIVAGAGLVGGGIALFARRNA